MSTYDGKPYGEAMCSNCWDVDKVQVYLVQTSAQRLLQCPNCKQEYGRKDLRREIIL